MAYKHITEEERGYIYRWIQEKHKNCKIAKLLGRATSSISREIKRNKKQREYHSKQAHEMAVERAHRVGPRTFTEEMRKDVENRIRMKETPEMIQGRVRLEGRPMVCKERIYQHIYTDAKNGGDLWEHLPRAKRKRHRRCPRKDDRGRGRIPDQRRIDTHPVEIETRERVGNWEGDLVVGAHGTGNLVTLVERKTRFLLVGHVQSKDATEVSNKITSLFANISKQARETITFDNGKEFAYHKEIARQNTMDVFFAHPYHSWERGTNENTNGLIRRLYHKGSSFANIGESELAKIDQYVNDRPRKCLDWCTPREAMNAFLVVAP
ncbi:MAG: IS30 family transposase [Candidatus Desantisbacteria bacterium]